jgi:hypothetical protein
MKISKTLIWLSTLVAVLAIIYASVGLFSQGGDGPYTFTTLHGSKTEMYGHGCSDALRLCSSAIDWDSILQAWIAARRIVSNQYVSLFPLQFCFAGIWGSL